KIASQNYAYRSFDLFSDFILMAKVALHNQLVAMDDDLEAQYMQVVARYEDKPEIISEAFPELMATLTLDLDHPSKFTDVLGETFMGLDLGNAYRGQFFTPFHLSYMMAQMTMGDEASIRHHIEQKGMVKISEPACGSGGMVLAGFKTLCEMGINPDKVFFWANDIDHVVSNMAYVQLSLAGVPAVVSTGNSLAMDEDNWEKRFTPALANRSHAFWCDETPNLEHDDKGQLILALG
ncbi:N-6 DNA methylase, partial [Hydrogenovibrio marinus]